MNPSWRWEVGAPLLLVGTFVAVSTAALAGGGWLFWIGVALVALGVVAFRAG